MPDTTNVRWGLAGTGTIAREFARTLAEVPSASLTAAASRTTAASEKFCSEYGIPNQHLSFQDLARDHTIDAVYVSTPAGLHHEHATLFMESGKHVLVEKPFTSTHAEALDLARTAKRTGTVLMEAMWSRFLPAYVELKRLVDDGAIGEVRKVEASFGFPIPEAGPRARPQLYDPALGGGSLLEMGVYPVQLSHWLLGNEPAVAAVGRSSTSGVDLDTTALLSFGDGATGNISSSMSTVLPNDARILGTEGYIQLPAPHHCPHELTVSRYNPSGPGLMQSHRIQAPIVGGGLKYEILEFHALLEAGRSESSVMPLIDSLAIMRTLDLIRHQIHNPSQEDLHPES
ncbi:Gfo/Idh/MocA family oxidoreductase [Pseudarthrobacter sp. R1]|uniref:Gfo/Idh/MocA family protein n=1 Tax=Pseudarthrobacter sp. R1 TaxID=2944934 RepID=UPI00210A131D|nr:Gfo/Idh/MocA family oxidoreductase [Pseudarthrobacter sp. R1]MCQ6271466.1 Gfo/Idh/MocA family oxidoreductase [Pseudarthrobacter sp. R1]